MKRIYPKAKQGESKDRYLLKLAQDQKTMKSVFDRIDLDDSGCWLWIAAMWERPNFGASGFSIKVPLLIFAWWKHRLPKGILAKTCGNKRCVRHFAEVTRQFMQQMKFSGRRKISICHAETIRAFYILRDPDFGVRALARRFGINRNSVSEIVNFRSYRTDAVCPMGDDE